MRECERERGREGVCERGGRERKRGRERRERKREGGERKTGR